MKREIFRNEKGQVSVFVILGVMIIGIVVGYFIVNSESFNFGQERVDPQVRPVYSMVDNCLENVGEDAIEYVSQSGGYYLLPEISTDLDIPYYIYDGENRVPSKEDVEGQISLYVLDNLGDCVSFDEFDDFEIVIGSVGIDSEIKEDRVKVKLNYELSIKKDEKTYEIENFEVEIPTRLDVAYRTALSTVLNEIDDLENVCISCVYELALENDLYVNSINYNDDTIIFTIIDKKLKINDEDFIFNFAIQYDR